MFAPALRNMLDRDPPVSAFAELVDVLCCNRGEWESLADREEVAWRVSILGGDRRTPRARWSGSPRPRGRRGGSRSRPSPGLGRRATPTAAGEAFASELIATLLRAGWTPGVTPPDLARLAADRASAAAALVLDRADFGFPDGRRDRRGTTLGASRMISAHAFRG